MGVDTTGAIPRLRIGVLGAITIAGYGCWYYAFGALLDAIIADTGWPESLLTTVFGVSALLGGAASLLGGWMLDRLGSRFVFGLGAVLGLVSFQVAASAETVTGFFVGGAVGGAAMSALAFYHVTQTVAVRIAPHSSTKAIAVLTIWGAFSSAIYLPAVAFLLDQLDWRATLRVITVSAVVVLAIGALVIDTKAGSESNRAVWSELRGSLGDRSARRLLVAQAVAGIGLAVILVYQVPAMTSAGLTLGAASFWAGFRGFAQIGGRIPLLPIVDRLGVVGALRLAYLVLAAGAVALAFAGTPLVAAFFAITAGFGIGAGSPLVGMYARDSFGTEGLGTAMGLLSLVFLLAGSLGPPVAGLVAEATGSRVVPVLGAAATVVIAAWILGGGTRKSVRPRPGPPGPDAR